MAGAMGLVGPGGDGYISQCGGAWCLLPSWRQSSVGDPMQAILDVVLIALDLYIWVVIASAILSWLVAFNVVNSRNQVVATIGQALYNLTEPVLRPIRRFMPNLGGLDISAIVLILVIFPTQSVIIRYIRPYVF
jgi:YggT family protein